MDKLFDLLIIVGCILAIFGLFKMPKEVRRQNQHTFLLKMRGPGTTSMKIGTILMTVGALALLF